MRPAPHRPAIESRPAAGNDSICGLVAALLVLLAAAGPMESPCFAAQAPATRQTAAPFIPDYRTRVEQVEPNRIGIRFAPETQARVRNGELVSLAGTDLSAVREIVASVPGARLEPRFRKSEQDLTRLRLRGEERTRQALPDLNLFALLLLPSAGTETTGRERLGNLLRELNAAPHVAEAWALPRPEPAAIAGSGPALPVSAERPSASAGVAGIPPSPATRSDTPDFSPLQGYLYASPVGVWADSAWTFSGGQGQGVKILSLEWGWLWSHEDLKPPFYLSNDQGPSDHGTAVVGIYGGQHNGYGVNGIAGDAEIGGIYLADLPSDILEAVSVLSPGDLYNMSIQVSGPVNWMPVEWWPDCFAVIQTGSALGVICMEAAGNGSVNLDDPLYGDYFDRRVRDSGAIIAGAGTPNGLDGEWFTNYGERVSLQAWGSSVVTTCCGDLQGGDPEVRYTAGFGGTSSATPILSGTIASLQGQALALFGVPLTPALAEEILSATGTPYNGTKAIGERPNLAAARERLVRGYGDVLVTVRDGETQGPLPDMIVRIAETGRLHKTGPDGQIAMQLSAGELTFRVSGNFFYAEEDFPFTVEAGGSQEVILEVDLRPQGNMAGIVRDQRGSPIAGARILLASTPIDPAWSGSDGAYYVAGIPEDAAYTVTASRVPTKGAVVERLDVTEGWTTPWNPILVDAETFEAGPAGYTATGEWEWGTPTYPNGQGRPIPFSGTKCWGTDLGGPYNNLTTSILTSPVFNLSGTSHLTLSFHHWMWIEADDGGQVQVWDAAQNRWVIVPPVGGYPDDHILCLGNGPGYNGRQPTWEPAVFELDAYAGTDFKFRLYFKTNEAGTGIGWYVDDVALDYGQGPTAVDLASFTPGGLRMLSAGPNPATGASRIRFALEAPAEIRCDLYNLTGTLVRRLFSGSLPAGMQEIAWDGRDERNRAVSSGVYLFKLTSGKEKLEGKLIRLR